MRGNVRFFLLLVLVLTVVTLIPFLVSLPQIIGQVRSALTSDIPPFTAAISNGQLTVSDIEQPFTYHADDGTRPFTIYVDTVSEAPEVSVTEISDDTDGGAVLMVTRDFVTMYQPDRGQTRSFEFRRMGDRTISRTMLLSLVNKHAWWVATLVVIGAFLALFVVTVIGKVFWVLFWSLLLLLVARIAHRVWTYRHVFTVGLLAVTLPSLVTVFMRPAVIPDIPFVSPLIFLVVMVAAILTSERTPQTEQPVPPTTPV